jgi:hypothetical protein
MQPQGAGTLGAPSWEKILVVSNNDKKLKVSIYKYKIILLAYKIS